MKTTNPDDLGALVSLHEEWLLRRVLDYAAQHHFTTYTLTLPEAWRAGIAGLSSTLAQALAQGPIAELGPDDDYARGPCATFGIQAARRHRGRGVTLPLFLALMKYHRRSYEDLVATLDLPDDTRARHRRTVGLFFDRVELGSAAEWPSAGTEKTLAELSEATREVVNERNRLLTIFESLEDPVVFFRDDGTAAEMNRAAALAFSGRAIPGASRSGEAAPHAPDFAKVRDAVLSRGGTGTWLLEDVETLQGKKTYELRLRPLLDEGRQFSGTVAYFRDATQEVAASRASREKETRYTDLFQNLHEGFALHEILLDDLGQPVDYRFLAVNPAFEHMVAKGADALVGRRVTEVFPDIEPKWIRTYGQVALTGETLGHAIHRRDLGRHYEVLAYRPGEKQFALLIRDTTERKQAEERLQVSEQKFRSYVDHAPDGVFVSDENGRYLEVNRAATALTGYSEQELLQRSIADLLPPEGRDVGLQHFLRLQEKGASHGELEYLHKNGTRRWWSVSAVKLSETRYLGFTKDVTARREAEEQLRRRSEALTERVKELRCLYSISLVLGRGDRSISETLAGVVDLIPEGWRDPDLTSARITALGEVFRSEGFRESPRRLASAIPVGGGTVGTVEIFAAEGLPDGDDGPFLREEAYLVDEIAQRLGELIGRLQIEAELREAKERAELASRMKSTFLANVSHELRTPMNSILGYTELLLDGVEGELEAAPRESLRRVERNARHLLRLIDELLDLSRIESDRFDHENVVFSVRALLDEAARSLSVLAKRKGLLLSVSVPPELPDLLVGDEPHLSQVLLNLGGNAIKFTPQGEVVLGVEQQGEEPAGIRLRFFVRDTGVGIRPEQQSAIFEAFVQGDMSSTRLHGGAGLGLAISTRLVAHLGGSLAVESEPGRGSTFHFTVTCSTAGRSDRPSPGSAGAEPPAPVQPSPPSAVRMARPSATAE